MVAAFTKIMEVLMKRLALLAIVVFSSYASAFAQNEKKPEFFAGYSFESVDTGVTSSSFGAATSLDNRFKVNGLNLSATTYFTKRFGVTGDFSAHYDSRPDSFGTTATQSKFSLYNITGGPQVRFPGTGRFTPFAQALAGIARRNLSETLPSGTNYFTDNNTSLTLNLGGGVDYKLNDRFSWRLVQFDYNPISLRGRTFNSIVFPNQTLNGFRFSTGIVIK
jgi:Outer membrane protein beta-barrel domain